MRASKSCFIRFTVRSGSSLLCQRFGDAGLAGVPQARFCHNISPDNPQGDRHFTRQPTKTVRQVLDFLDVAVPLDFQMPTPAHQPVGGALAEAWTQRFRAEKQAAMWTAFW